MFSAKPTEVRGGYFLVPKFSRTVEAIENARRQLVKVQRFDEKSTGSDFGCFLDDFRESQRGNKKDLRPIQQDFRVELTDQIQTVHAGQAGIHQQNVRKALDKFLPEAGRLGADDWIHVMTGQRQFDQVRLHGVGFEDKDR